MSKHGEVESLFNDKAAAWNEKYSAHGPLHHRLDAFEKRLRQLAPPPANVFDFGCGTGNLACHLSACGYTLSACDISAKMLEAARQGNPGAPVEWFVLSSDWQQLPLASDVFDAIVASSVFEYLNDIDATLKEFHRILKPGGVLIATVPNPRKPIRKLEHSIRPVVALIGATPLLNRIPKIRSYAAYLKCSRHRLPMEEWFALGKKAGFIPVPPNKNPSHADALDFLCLRKQTNIPHLA